MKKIKKMNGGYIFMMSVPIITREKKNNLKIKICGNYFLCFQ